MRKRRREWGSAVKKRRRWYAVYEGPRHPDGKRNQVWEPVAPNTQQSALDLLIRRRAELVAREWEAPNATVEFALLAQEWYETMGPLWKVNTREVYRTMLELHVLPVIGRLDARQIDTPVVQRFIGKKLSEGLSPRYIRDIVQVVNNVLRYGHKHGRLRHLAVLHLELPKIRRRRVDPYTPGEVRMLLEAACEWRPLIAWAIWTGMRQGEILAAKWSNVDTAMGVYHVKENLNRHLEFASTKTGEEADVWLSPFVMGELEDQRRQVAVWQLSAAGWEDNDLIFPRPKNGRPWRHTTVNHAYKHVCDVAGVPYRNFHNLRHTCASLLLAQGENIKVIQKQLRHADVRVTLSVYSHLMPEAGPEALLRLDEIVREAV